MNIHERKFKINIRIVFAIVFTIALLSTLFFKEPFVDFVNSNTYVVEYQNNLAVHFVDVGQGKAIAIRLPDGKSVLIDCGRNTAKEKLFTYLDEKFFAQNTEYNVLDYFILTHPDSDHMDNAVEVFEKFEVKNVYRPYIFASSETEQEDYYISSEIEFFEPYENFINAVYAENCNIFFNFAGQEILGDNYALTFLSPNQMTYNSSNDFSPIIKLEFNGKSFLFTGDATTNNENEVLNLDADLQADVLDISHHGSNTSSTQNFLNAVSPTYAVISVDENSYGHPNENVLNRILIAGVLTENIFRTDTSGHIVFNINENGELAVATVPFVLGFKTHYSWAEIFATAEIMLVLGCAFFPLGRSDAPNSAGHHFRP
ncbi:MAG: MBL fold metallo-hydrolase [Clostridia bacterium]|nr:MBL fold metallo-hydrolase [Clostridia bacterium]